MNSLSVREGIPSVAPIHNNNNNNIHNRRNERKRPRVKISLAGVNVVAPPEQGFDTFHKHKNKREKTTGSAFRSTPNVTSPILGEVTDSERKDSEKAMDVITSPPNLSLSRKPSWENVPDASHVEVSWLASTEKEATVAATEDPPRVPATTTASIIAHRRIESIHQQSGKVVEQTPRGPLQEQTNGPSVVSTVTPLANHGLLVDRAAGALEEEDAILQQLDDEISRAEEQEIIHSLEQEILRQEGIVAVRIEAKNTTVASLPTPLITPRGLDPRPASSGLRIVTINRSLPRILKPCNGIVYTENEFQTDFVDVFRHQIAKKDPSKLENFQVSLQVGSQPHRYDMNASMDESLADEFQKKVKGWTSYKVAMLRIEELLNDPESVVFDVFMEWRKIGIHFWDLDPNVMQEQPLPALNAFPFHLGGQGYLLKTFGPGLTKPTAVVLQVDGISFRHVTDLYAYLRKPSVKKSFVKVTICVHKSVNLTRNKGPMPTMLRLGDWQEKNASILDNSARGQTAPLPSESQDPSTLPESDLEKSLHVGVESGQDGESMPSQRGKTVADSRTQQVITAAFPSGSTAATLETIVKEWPLSRETKYGGIAFTKEDYETNFLEAFLQKAKDKRQAMAESLKVVLHDHWDTIFVVTAYGPADFLSELKKASLAWARHQGNQYHLRRLLGDGDSMIFDYFARPDDLGFVFDEETPGRTTQSSTCSGVLVSIDYAMDGLLISMFGPAITAVPLAILAVNGSAVSSPVDLKGLLDRKRRAKSFARLTFCLQQDVDLSLAPQHLPDIRRIRFCGVNGQSKLNVDDDDPSVESTLDPPVIPTPCPQTPDEIEGLTKSIIRSESSVEVDLWMEVAENLGAGFHTSRHDGGLVWLHTFRVDGQLSQALGKDFGTWGAILFAINGIVIKSMPQFQRIRCKLQDRKLYRITLVFLDGVDLKDVSPSRLVGPPRRRNGKRYPMHLPDGSSVSTGRTDDSAKSSTSTQMSSVLVNGPPDSVDAAILPFSPPKTKTRLDEVIENIMTNVRSVEVEVQMPVKKPLGGKLYAGNEYGFLHDFDEAGSLAFALGKEACKYGLVLLELNGVRIRTATELKSEKGKCCTDDYVLKVACFEGVDLRGCDSSRLVRPPRRRNGDEYPLRGGQNDNRVLVPVTESSLHDESHKDSAMPSSDLPLRIETLHNSPFHGGQNSNIESTESDPQGSRDLAELSALKDIPSDELSRRSEQEDSEAFLEWAPVDFIKTSALPDTIPGNDAEYAEAIKRIVDDPRSVRLHLLVPSDVSLGARLFFDATIIGYGWLFHFKPDQTLSKIFGHAFGNWGVVLESINGIRVRSSNDFMEEKLRSNGDLKLCVLCFYGIDLSSMDRSRISKCPRQVNGDKYPFLLHPKHNPDPGIFATRNPEQVEYVVQAADPEAYMESKLRKGPTILPFETGNNEITKDLVASSSTTNDALEKYVHSPSHGPVTPSNSANQQLRRANVNPMEKTANVRGKTQHASETMSAINALSSQTCDDRSISQSGSTPNVLLLAARDSDSGTLDDIDHFPTRDEDEEDSPSTVNGSSRILTSVIPKRRLSETSLSSRLYPPNKQQQTTGSSDTLATNDRHLATYSEFKKVMDSSKPLGVYFVEEFVENVKKCTVHSVVNGGQLSLDTRIRQGTIVEAICIGKQKEQVRSVAHLKHKYNCASKLGRSMKLVFKTPFGVSVPRTMTTGDNSWAHDGQWIGEDLGGWDGGASKIQATNERRSLASKHPLREKKTTKVGRTDSAPKQAPKSSLKAAQKLLEEEVNIQTYTGTQVKKPLQRKKRNVSFGESSVFIIENRDDVPIPAPHPLSSYDRFLNAVNHQSCKDLIEALESGASLDPQVLTSGIRDCYANVKDRLDRVETSIGFNPTDKKFLRDQKDLIAKKKVLSIYSNASVLLEKALNLQHWACFELRIVHADFRTTDETWKGLPTNAMVSGEITTAVRGENRTREKLGKLEPQELRQFILFEGSTAVKFNNNHRILLESRQIQIDFWIDGATQRMVENTPFASFVLPLNDIHKNCPNYDQSARMEISVLIPNYHLKSGEVTVEAKRLRLDRSYTDGKARDVFKGINEEIEQIKKFNMDYKDAMEIPPNIRGPEGSFLHAAVWLVKLPLIEKLRGLGYRFVSNSNDLNDPLVRALSTRDRAREKLEQTLEVGQTDPNGIRAKKDNLRELDAIVETMTKMLTNKA